MIFLIQTNRDVEGFSCVYVCVIIYNLISDFTYNLISDFKIVTVNPK